MGRTKKKDPSSPRSSARERLAERGIDFDEILGSLGHTIRAHRRAKGHTQEALAERMGVSVPWVGVLECARGSPSLEMLTLFAAALDTSPGDLLNEAMAGSKLKGPARAGVADLHAALAELSPAQAEAVCASVVSLCRTLRQA